jgi:acetyl esterase/lipase
MTRSTRRRLSSVLCIAASAALAAVGLAAATTTPDIGYDRGSPPYRASLNALDVHVPDAPSRAPRPVVVLAHGGGWSHGSKESFEQDKARALTDAGYVVVNVNYRLSPHRPPATWRPGRIRHPDHVDDVAEAVGWVHDEIARFGGDPDRIALLGHSAGAHLVSLVGTDPSHLDGAAVPRSALRAVVSLDSAAYDVRGRIERSRGATRRMYTTAFGRPREERRDPRWRAASPLMHADASDPPELVVTQRRNARRRAEATRFATALGQRAGDVLALDYDHAAMSRRLGSADDPERLTDAVLAFLARELG